MSSGQYILPGELAAILGFVLLPAAVLVLASQALFLHKKGLLRSSPGKTAAALLGTLLLGSVIGVAILLFAPGGYGRFLGIRELNLVGHVWPVWPLGFVALAASAVFTSSLLLGGNKSESAQG